MENETTKKHEEKPKKQHKIGSLSPVGIMIIAAVAILVAVPLRTYQLANCIDPSTGFWLVKDFSYTILIGLGIAVIVLGFILTRFCGIMPRPHFQTKKSGWLGLLGLLLALGFVYDAVQNGFNGAAYIQNYDPQTASLWYYLMSTGALSGLLQALFALLSGIYFAVYAISMFSGTGAYKKRRALALSPVLYVLFRLMGKFVDPISYKNVSQLFLELLFMGFGIVFFLSFARIASSVNESSSMWILYFTGVVSAFFAYCAAMAPFVLMITGHSQYICSTYPMQYVDLTYALFVTGVLLSNLPLTVHSTMAGDAPAGTPDAAAAEREAGMVAGKKGISGAPRLDVTDRAAEDAAKQTVLEHHNEQ